MQALMTSFDGFTRDCRGESEDEKREKNIEEYLFAEQSERVCKNNNDDDDVDEGREREREGKNKKKRAQSISSFNICVTLSRNS